MKKRVRYHAGSMKGEATITKKAISNNRMMEGARPVTSNLEKTLLDHNREQSAEYCSPDADLWRRKYRIEHPTEIGALKCMDGRLNLAVITQTPPGIIQPFRNLGGQFCLGWPFFQEVIDEWVNYAISRSPW